MPPRLRPVVVVLPMLAALAVAQTQTPYKKDQKIEVREGDVWSGATVLEQEGRRVHVKYDDGSDEWVPLARARMPGTAATPGTTGTTAAGTATPEKPDAKPAEPPKEKLPLAGKCEVKNASSWKPATIKNRDGDLYLIIYDGWEDRMFWEWVSSDCVRTVGSHKAGPSWGRGVKVSGRGVEQAKADAKKELPKWKEEYAAEIAQAKADANAKVAGNRAEEAKQRAEAMHGKPGAFDPAPYDKPIATAKAANLPAQQARRPANSTYQPAAAAEIANADPIALAKGAWGGRSADVIAAGTFAVAVSTQGRDLATVQIIDLAAGTATDPMDFDPLSKPFAVSNDGKTLIGRSDNFFGGTKLRLDFFDVTPGELKHRISFEPYGKLADKNDRDVTFAAMTDGVVVTSNDEGELAGWTLSTSGEPTVTCKWRTTVGGRSVALSPDGKTVAAGRDDGLYLIDVATGGTRAFVPASRSPGRLVFTPDGKRVVGISGPVLVSFDLASRKAEPDVGLPPGVFGRSIVGVGPAHVLLDDGFLFDLDRHAVTWKYDGAADVFAAGGRTWARTGEGGRTLLTPAKLPDPTAERAAVAAAEPLFKAGDAISLDISVEADAKQQTSIREHFTKELKRIGLTVADNQPIRLVVRTENGKSTQEKWERMGGAPWNRESADVTITDKISNVTIESNGKLAWQTFTTSRVGGMVNAKAGQGIAESVQAANQFNLGFFTNVTLPTFVPKPREPLVAGSTKWVELAKK